MYRIPFLCRSRFALLVLMLGAIMLTGCMRRYVSVEEVDKMIKAQLPTGSDKQQVKAFIDNLQVGSRKIVRDTEFTKVDWRFVGTEGADKIAVLGSRVTEYIGAVILKAQSDGFITSDEIVIVFYMDKDGRMIDYYVKMRGSV